MAGNIPLVGFHDFLSVLISGHKVLVKQSSNDKHLLPFLAKYLEKENYAFWNLGHPYMQYKFDLGAIKYSRDEFLKRWLPKVFI